MIWFERFKDRKNNGWRKFKTFKLSNSQTFQTLKLSNLSNFQTFFQTTSNYFKLSNSQTLKLFKLFTKKAALPSSLLLYLMQLMSIPRILVFLPGFFIQWDAIFIGKQAQILFRPWTEGVMRFDLSFPIPILTISICRIGGYWPPARQI